ncbi:hypothetical protein HPG69_018521, partial [Diceros bicornis minor]
CFISDITVIATSLGLLQALPRAQESRQPGRGAGVGAQVGERGEACCSQEVRTTGGLWCALRSPPSVLTEPLRMEWTTRELFLNFTVVLITVILMWLLVRSYQY